METEKENSWYIVRPWYYRYTRPFLVRDIDLENKYCGGHYEYWPRIVRSVLHLFFCENMLCMVGLHISESHLDYIYGTLPREHAVCKTCGTTTYFSCISEEREEQLPLVDCFEHGKSL